MCLLTGSVRAQESGNEITDQLTATSLDLGSSYANFTATSSTTGITFKGQGMANSTGAIQLRSKNNNSGIIITDNPNGYTLKSITIEWNSNTTDGRTLDIYGKNTAYTSSDASDLYSTDAATQGESLGSIVKGTSTSIDISGSYQFIGMRSNNGAMYITKITLVWQAGSVAPTQCAAPTFTPATGETFADRLNVKLACATEGAKIYYTTDGTTEPDQTSSLYDDATGIDLTATATIMAKAFADGLEASTTATATYTKVDVLDGLAALRAAVVADNVTNIADAKEYCVKLTNAVVTKKADRVVFIEQDGNGFYCYFTNTLAEGNTLNGTSMVKGMVYNGWPELTALSLDNLTVTEGATVTPLTVTLEQLNNSYDTYHSRLVKIEGADVTKALSASERNGEIKQGDITYVVRSNSSSITSNFGDNINLVCVPGIYNDVKQLYVYAQEDITVNAVERTFKFDVASVDAVLGEPLPQMPVLTNTYVDQNVQYSSGNADVATVDAATGEVTLAGAGQTAITAALASDPNITASYTLNVALPAVSLPEFSVAEGYLAKGTAILATCATEDATIRYTIGDVEPTAESDVFPAGGYILNENVKINLMAMKEGMQNSAVASATFKALEEGSRVATFNIKEMDVESGYKIKDNPLVDADNLVTVTADFGTNTNNDPGIFGGAGNHDLRTYKGNTLTFTAAEGYVLSEILFEGATGMTLNYTTDQPTWTAPTWTGEAESVTFTNDDASNTRNIQYITVILKEFVAPEIAAPTLSVAAGTYDAAQSVTITSASEDVKILYSTNGTELTAANIGNGVTEAANPCTVEIKESCTLNALAISADGKYMSDAVSAEYRIVTITGNGTLNNPYTTDDVLNLALMEKLPTEQAWVKGTIVGSCNASTGDIITEGDDMDTNMAMGSADSYITVQLPKGNMRDMLNVKDNAQMKGREVTLLGTPTNSYIAGHTGIKAVEKAAGINSISVRTIEGYTTSFNTYAYEMPEGLSGAIALMQEDGNVKFDYIYNAGDIVPNGTALLIKNGEKDMTYPVINVNSNEAAAGGNLLHGGPASVDAQGLTHVEPATAGNIVTYYAFNYNEQAQADLGFYWADDKGSAFVFTEGIERNLAFMAIESADGLTPSSFSIEGIGNGINGVTATGVSATDRVYTISGVRVNATNSLPKGLYIINGKKVAVR